MTKTCKNCGHGKSYHYNGGCWKYLAKIRRCPCKKFEAEDTALIVAKAIVGAGKPQKGCGKVSFKTKNSPADVCGENSFICPACENHGPDDLSRKSGNPDKRQLPQDKGSGGKEKKVTPSYDTPDSNFDLSEKKKLKKKILKFVNFPKDDNKILSDWLDELAGEELSGR